MPITLASLFRGPGEIKSREVEWDSQDSPGETKSREVELGSHSRMICLAAKLFLNSCFSGTVSETFRIAVETAISEAHKMIHTGKAPLPP